jgi:hypothetical protein
MLGPGSCDPTVKTRERIIGCAIVIVATASLAAAGAPVTCCRYTDSSGTHCQDQPPDRSAEAHAALCVLVGGAPGLGYCATGCPVEPPSPGCCEANGKCFEIGPGWCAVISGTPGIGHCEGSTCSGPPLP